MTIISDRIAAQIATAYQAGFGRIRSGSRNWDRAYLGYFEGPDADGVTPLTFLGPLTRSHSSLAASRSTSTRATKP